MYRWFICYFTYLFSSLLVMFLEKNLIITKHPWSETGPRQLNFTKLPENAENFLVFLSNHSTSSGYEKSCWKIYIESSSQYWIQSFWALAGVGLITARPNLLRQFQKCQLLLPQESNCQYHYKGMRYSKATSSSKLTQCTNVCPSGSNGQMQTFWKYNFIQHMTEKHPI